MPTFRTALTISQEYDGGSGSTMTVPLTGAQVGDTVVVLHGIDYANNPSNGNGIPAMTGSGITVTTRTTLTFNTESSNCAFVAASTAVVTSASSPSFTVGSGNRDSAVAAAWAILPGQWDFVSAGTTGTSTTSSNTIDTPTLAAAAGDTWFGAYMSEYQHTGQWTLPAGTSGGVHFFGVTDQGAVGACWEDLVSGDISGGQVSGRTGTKTGTARRRSAAAIVMRPAVTSVTHGGAASFAGAGAMSVTGQATRQATAAFAGAGAMAVSTQQTHRASVSFAGSGSLTAGSGVVRPATATFAGSGQMTAAGTRIHSAAASFTGSGALVATPGGLAQATFAGAGELTAQTRQTHQAVVSLAGAGQLTSTVFADQQATVTFAGAGQMLADARPVRPATAAFAGAGELTADGRRVHPATWSATGAGALFADGTRIRPAAAVFAGSGRMQASARLDKPGVNLSLWAVLPSNVLAPLPAFETLEVSRERNGVGSVRVDYPAAGAGFGYLRAAVVEDRPVEVEMWLGGSRTRPLRARLTQTSGDDLDGRAVWSFAGGFAEADLADGVVYPQPAPAERGELRFDNKNPGHIVLTVLQQAQARGALTGMGRDWTTTLDSSGQAWPSVVSGLKYSPKTTLLAILQDLADKDLAEFEVIIDDSGGKVLRLWAPDRRGTDRTTGAEPTLFRYGRISASPLRHSTRDTVTAILAIGADGLSATASDASAQARVGRRIEGTVDAGNIDNQAALTAYAQAALSALTKGQEEIRHPLTFGPGDPRPLAGYDLADRVLSERAGGARRGVDVQQWTLTANRQRVTDGEVVLNDLIASRLQRLARQVDRITSGGAVIGSSESPLIDDVTPPAAPTGLVIDSIAYQDAEHSQTLAAVTVGWSPVTTNAAGPATERAQAAAAILARILSGDPIGEDWTWTGAPPIVGVHNDPLLAAFELAEPEATSTVGAEGQAWLDAYVDTNSAGSTATDDVAGYRVRYAGLGLDQVGPVYESDPGPALAWREVTPAAGVSGTSFTFGGVDAGIAIRVQVQAFDNSGNHSQWSAPIDHTTESDNTPPEAPSDPVQRIWFRTLDTHWDGLDFAGAPMAVDTEYVAVLMSQEAAFSAPTIGQPVVFDPAVTTVQHVANLTVGGGTWNQPDLPVGVGWYSALVAVDRTGNVSAMSAIVGPATAEQLVSQDLIDDIIDATKLGPDSVESQHVVNSAITSAKILDAAIVNAKIANLAVNDAKVETLSVGKLVTGTLLATVTISGIMQTAASGRRMVIDSNGWRAYLTDGVTKFAELDMANSTFLMTGTYRSAMSGERINILPDGTIRIYPASSSSYSEIANFNGEVVWRGLLDSNGRSGRINVGMTSVGINFSSAAEVPSNLRSEIVLFDRYVRNQATVLELKVDRRYATSDGFEHRILFNHSNASGGTVAASVIHYLYEGGDPSFIAPTKNSGIKWDDGIITITSGNYNNFGPIQASNVAAPSSIELKDDVRDARALLDPLAVIRAARSKAWKYTFEQVFTPPATPENPNPEPVVADAPDHVGPIAEDLPPSLQMPMKGPGGLPTVGVSLFSQLGVLWGAMGQLQDSQLVSTTGRVSVTTLGGVAMVLQPGQSIERDVLWDSTPPAVPTGGLALVQVGVSLVGRVTAWIKTGSTTATGATVVIKNISAAPILPTVALPINVEVVGLGTYIPPFQESA